MTQESYRKKPLRVQVGREFQIAKPRFVDTFVGQILVLIIAAVVTAIITTAIIREEPPAILPSCQEISEESK